LSVPIEGGEDTVVSQELIGPMPKGGVAVLKPTGIKDLTISISIWNLAAARKVAKIMISNQISFMCITGILA
jgi:hypothetical protein